MEHLQHFGLRIDPFQIEPDLRFYYDSTFHSDAQRRVERGLRQCKGLSILTGEGGTGKSLLARRILEGLEEEMFEAALMVILPGSADGRSVVTRFARHLEIEELSDDPAQAIGQVYEQLATVREDGRHSVLIMDDAHLLGTAALAEVGALLSLEYEDRRLVSILLLGLPDLDAEVASDRSLSQRVDIRVRLSALDFDSATAYLANRLEVAGGEPGIIPEDAVGALFKYGCGRPRLMNTLADNALFEAYLAGRHQIDASDVERAAADLSVEPGPERALAQGGAALAPASGLINEAGATSQPIEALGQAPAPDVADDEDLSALLEPVGSAASELDLDTEIGENSEFEFPERAAAGETRLMLGDDSEAAIELGDPIEPDDEVALPEDGRALEPGAAAEGKSELETGSAGEQTRLLLPEDDASLAIDAADGDEIEALFDQLLDD